MSYDDRRDRRDRSFDHGHDEYHDYEAPFRPAAAPGKRTLTSGLPAVRRPPGVQARAAGAERPGPPDGADAAVERASAASGQPLPGPLRRRFERAVDTELGGVRIHTGAASQQAAREVGALAYTYGQDIHFGAGQYDPDSDRGQHLLAHEIAHTVQQRGGGAVQPRLADGASADAAEAEADRFADAFVRGGTAPVVTAAPAALARREDPSAAGQADQEDEPWWRTERELKVTPAYFEQLGKAVGKRFPDLSLQIAPDGAVTGKATLEFPGATFKSDALSHSFPTPIPGVVVTIGGTYGVGLKGKLEATATGKFGQRDEGTDVTVKLSGGTELAGEAKFGVGAGLGAPGMNVSVVVGLGSKIESPMMASASATVRVARGPSIQFKGAEWGATAEPTISVSGNIFVLANALGKTKELIDLALVKRELLKYPIDLKTNKWGPAQWHASLLQSAPVKKLESMADHVEAIAARARAQAEAMKAQQERERNAAPMTMPDGSSADGQDWRPPAQERLSSEVTDDPGGHAPAADHGGGGMSTADGTSEYVP